MAKANDLSVGDLPERSGLTVSALHFYEAEGLIESWRTAANHRRYDRRELRRLAIIRIAQTVGIPLSEVREVLSRIPRDRAVSASDWQSAAAPWTALLDRRISLLTRLRDQLGSCMGCGCLSVEACPLHNPGDRLGDAGPGPRRWMPPT